MKRNAPPKDRGVEPPYTVEKNVAQHDPPPLWLLQKTLDPTDWLNKAKRRRTVKMVDDMDNDGQSMLIICMDRLL